MRRYLSLWLGFAAAILAGALGLPDSSSAFHDGGVAHCSACHTMHNSQDGVPLGQPGGTATLLLYANSTDLCLSCHADGDGAVFGVDPLNPPTERGGGNFVFLLEDELNDAPDGMMMNPIDGSHAGHNVESALWGIPVDLEHPVSPGGTYASDNLTCTSCHDPHGTSNFRLLRGPESTDASGFTFTAPAPVGQGIDLSGPGESIDNHTAYQSGWGEWCGNCHGLFHEGFGQRFRHPGDHGLGDEWQTYNAYDGPSAPNGGDYNTAYLPEVPIEDPVITPFSTSGARGASQVMCMSCHRAHATSAPKALRWDPNVQFLIDDGFVSGSYPIPSPYPEPDQRALCVKCHYGEAMGHGFGRACLECHRNRGH